MSGEKPKLTITLNFQTLGFENSRVSTEFFELP